MNNRTNNINKIISNNNHNKKNKKENNKISNQNKHKIILIPIIGQDKDYN